MTAEPTLRAAVGTVLYFGLVALLSLGVGAIIRDSAGALTAVLTLLYLFPILGAVISDPQWRERVAQLAPSTAGMSIQATTRLDQLAIGPWAGLGVLAGYAAGAMVLGAIVFLARDA